MLSLCISTNQMVVTKPSQFGHAFGPAGRQSHISVGTAQVIYTRKRSVNGTAQVRLAVLGGSGKAPLDSLRAVPSHCKVTGAGPGYDTKRPSETGAGGWGTRSGGSLGAATLGTPSALRYRITARTSTAVAQVGPPVLLDPPYHQETPSAGCPLTPQRCDLTARNS